MSRIFKQTFFLILLLSTLCAQNKNTFLSNVHTIFGYSRSYTNIQSEIASLDEAIPLQFLTLKIKEGLKKRVPLLKLESTTITHIQFYKDCFDVFKNSKDASAAIKSEPLYYSYLLDFKTYGFELSPLCNLFIKIATSLNIPNHEKFSYLDKSLQLYSYEFYKTIVQSIVITHFDTSAHRNKLSISEFYFNYAIESRLDINQAADLFLRAPAHFSKKQLLNMLDEIK